MSRIVFQAVKWIRRTMECFAASLIERNQRRCLRVAHPKVPFERHYLSLQRPRVSGHSFCAVRITAMRTKMLLSFIRGRRFCALRSRGDKQLCGRPILAANAKCFRAVRETRRFRFSFPSVSLTTSMAALRVRDASCIHFGEAKVQASEH